MHIPRHFQETRRDVLYALMHAYPFATVVAQTADGLVANHLPFERVGDVLQTHVARGNEMVGMDGQDVLVMFRGPQAYISPNWYPTKHENGREVPTWDYVVVHVHGHMKIIDDAVWLRDLLERLTTRHEAGEPEPWQISDAPADHVEKSLRAIVGVEIPIERVIGKFKLNQNHPERNRRGIIEGLQRRGTGDDRALLALIKQQLELSA